MLEWPKHSSTTWEAQKRPIHMFNSTRLNWGGTKSWCITFIYISLSHQKRGTSQVALVVKNPPANTGRHKRCGFDPWVRKIPLRRAWQPTPVFIPGDSHGQGSLVGYSSRVTKSWTWLSIWAEQGFKKGKEKITSRTVQSYPAHTECLALFIQSL